MKMMYSIITFKKYSNQMEKFNNAKLQLLLYQPTRDKYSQKEYIHM